TLKSLKAAEKSRLGERFTNERIPHLKDFVAFLQEHPQIRAFVEMKDESLQRYGLGSVLPRVMEALKPVQHQVNQISFSLPWCQILRRETQYPVGFIAENYNQLSDPAVQVLKPEFLCVDYQALPAQGSVVQPGSALFCWEVADPALALQLHARGVDYVETYEIGEMLKALK